jgi:hypothetical protein
LWQSSENAVAVGQNPNEYRIRSIKNFPLERVESKRPGLSA